MNRFCLSAVGLLVLVIAPPSGSHDEPPTDTPKTKALTIRWYGQSFFQVETAKGFKFAFDPHGIEAFGRARVKADFVLVSHTHDDHSLIEMIDVGEDPKTKEFKVIPASDVYRGVVEVRPGKQEWKSASATSPPTTTPSTACNGAKTASSLWKSMVWSSAIWAIWGTN
jgi:hypothetical protein